MIPRSYERPKLNERPIVLKSMFMCLALSQSLLHLYRDYDRVPIPERKDLAPIETIEQKSQRPLLAPLHDLQQKVIAVANRSVLHTMVMTAVAPFVYWFFIRQKAWSFNFWFARQVYSLPKVAKQPVFPPLFADLLGRFIIEAFLLTFSWELANAAFDLYIAQAPMKQGRLLTEESADPNGSLLNGLKATRSVPRAFAFWELALISNYMPQRRQLIYQDIARSDGSSWSQVHTICLGELHAVVKRIHDSRAPAVTAAGIPQQPQQGLPKLGNSVRQDNIYTPPKPVAFSAFRGQDPKAYNVVETGAMKAIEYASAHGPKQEQISKDSVTGLVRNFMIMVVRSPVGGPLRQSFARRVRGVILGGPYSSLGFILDSVTSLSKFVVHSKKEDRFGTVYRDIPNVIRTFTSSHMAIQSYVSGLDVHWTDVWFKEEDRRVPDVQLLLKSLEDGLRGMVSEFGEYADDLGLSAAEMRAAKQIVASGEQKTEDMRRTGTGEEMRQVRR